MRRHNLIAMRKKRGWVQKDVVRELKRKYGIEITESYYGMIEQGVRTPQLRIAVAIADLFGKSVEDIFFDVSPNKMLCKRSVVG